MFNKSIYKFILVFFATFFLQYLFLNSNYYIDFNMWANQAKYVETGDTREFDTTAAYGHPGGPIILGTIAAKTILGVTFEKSLVIFLSLINSLIILLVCFICNKMYQKSLWWLTVLGILSVNTLYMSVTPPSLLASLIFILLLISLIYIDKNKILIKTSTILFPLAIILGLLVSTRFDIGICSAIFFCAFLYFTKKISVQNLSLLSICSFAIFFATDPFMWFMPIQHIVDLFGKMTYHYSAYHFEPLPFGLVISFSWLPLISILVCSLYVFLKRNSNYLSKRICIAFILLTFFLYTIFLSSNYQAVRYFVPIILFWQLLLPLYAYDLRSSIEGSKNFYFLFDLLFLLVFVVYPIMTFLFFMIFHLW